MSYSMILVTVSNWLFSSYLMFLILQTPLTSDYWDSLSLASFSKIALSICLTTGLS